MLPLSVFIITKNEEARLPRTHGADLPRAYRIKILNVYPGNEKPRCFANDYNVVRFYHCSVAHYGDHPVYDRVFVLSGKPRQLERPSTTTHMYLLVMQ